MHAFLLRAGRPARSPRPPKPRGEKVLDRAAALWALKAARRFTIDYHERRQRLHPETLDQVGMLVGADALKPKGLVVVAPLKHLREKAFDSAAQSRGRSVEEEQPWPGVVVLLARGLVQL